MSVVYSGSTLIWLSQNGWKCISPITVIGSSCWVQALSHPPPKPCSPLDVCRSWKISTWLKRQIAQRTSDKSVKHVNTACIFPQRWKSLSYISFITGVCFVKSITSWLTALCGLGAVMWKQRTTCVWMSVQLLLAAGPVSDGVSVTVTSYRGIFRSERRCLSSAWLLLSTSGRGDPRAGRKSWDNTSVCCSLHILVR